jgi:O-antigen/teichoic acid export membrane protein
MRALRSSAAQVQSIGSMLWGVPRRVFVSRLARDYTLAGGGVGLARLASVATLVLLTRALTTHEFALYSLGWATWLLTSQMLSGIDIAYVDLQAREDDAGAFLRPYWSFKLTAAGWLMIATIIVIILLRGPASWGRTEVEAAIIGGASGVATALYQTELSVRQATRRFGRYAIGWILLNGSILIGTISLVVVGVDTAFPYLVAYGAAPLVLIVFAGARRLRSTTLTRSAKSRAEIVRHAKWLLPSGILTSVSSRIEVFIASALLFAHDFALYGAMSRFFGVFGFALTSMGSVLLPRASSLGRDTSVRSYLTAAAGLIGATGFVGALCVWQAHRVTLLLLGEAYVGAASLMPAICVAATFLAADVTLGYLLFSIGRPGAFAFLAALVLVAKVVAGLLLIPVLHATGAAWSLAAGYVTATTFIAVMLFVDRERLSAGSRGAWSGTGAISSVG